ncbi:MAG: D-alanine--poly(phosphoribitol) ligase subunit DltC [Liquorilactobacillus ghanensis]|uniref:D-alanine--poly(phosphoribitol) ligase subunit DltC n=2 Tax=Liquorilactobacillus ghanensis TaxID=399370 RepID=UPI0039E9732D
MDDIKNKVIEILADVTSTDKETVRSWDGQDLFQNGFLDSMGTVELLVQIQDELDINVPVSEFDRSQWNTLDKICDQIRKL